MHFCITFAIFYLKHIWLKQNRRHSLKNVLVMLLETNTFFFGLILRSRLWRGACPNSCRREWHFLRTMHRSCEIFFDVNRAHGSAVHRALMSSLVVHREWPFCLIITGHSENPETHQDAVDREVWFFACWKNNLINDVMQSLTSLSQLVRLPHASK